MTGLKYTTINAIARRLEGRLQLGGSQSPFGDKVVDDDLICQVAQQVEAKVDAWLRQIYVLPLQYPHKEVESVVEKLAIAELIPVHFTGSDSDSISSYGKLMYDEGMKEAKMLGSGDIQLENETLRYAPKSVVPNRTRVITPKPKDPVNW